MDAGSPPKFSTTQLHLESIHQAPPSTPPLAFLEEFYNFTVLETSSVALVVGVVSLTRSSSGVWFDFSGKTQLHSASFFLVFIVSLRRVRLIVCLCLLLEAPRSSREVFYVVPGSCIRNCSLEGSKALILTLTFICIATLYLKIYSCQIITIFGSSHLH